MLYSVEDQFQQVVAECRRVCDFSLTANSILFFLVCFVFIETGQIRIDRK